MFTLSVETSAGQITVEFFRLGWRVAPAHVHVVQGLSFSERRALAIHVDELREASLAGRASVSTADEHQGAGGSTLQNPGGRLAALAATVASRVGS